jgi:hypothetical protein
MQVHEFTVFFIFNHQSRGLFLPFTKIFSSSSIYIGVSRHFPLNYSFSHSFALLVMYCVVQLVSHQSYDLKIVWFGENIQFDVKTHLRVEKKLEKKPITA